jgi:hypothetical protein
VEATILPTWRMPALLFREAPPNLKTFILYLLNRLH